MPPAAHALLGASSAHRWLACPPSARLEASKPDSTSEAAAEGTLAHELVELKLKRFLAGRKTGKATPKIAGHELYRPVMEEYGVHFRRVWWYGKELYVFRAFQCL